eukprot:jgi/Undpi1/13605/HiC_scaffold_9.g03259.m1
MATRVGLLRARGRARGAHLVCGQHQLCGLVSCAGNGSGSSQLQATIPGRPSTNNSRLRLLARLSSKSSADIGGGSNRIRHEAAGGLLTSAHKKYSPPSFLGIDSLSHKAAVFSSNAKPSQDVEDDDEDWEGEEGEAGEGLDYSAGFEGFEGETKEERLARLDDGDQYKDFVNLRLEEVEKLFPEGLAGGSQGALERATSRGTSAALLRREAADALIQSLDGFAEAGATGIEGTGSDKWKEISNVYSAAAKKRGAEGEQEGCGEEEGGGGGIGDVAAAAAEGVAAAAAAAEAAEAAASAVAAPAAAGMEAGGQGDTADGEGVEEKKVLGDGPIWAEMKALAESKRKPLKGVARVRVRPGQRSYLLSGRRGSGKSCVLNQIVLHARSTGWVVLFVPDARNLVQKGIYCQPSPTFENLYDLPVQSLKRLKTLRNAHADQLKDIHIQDPKVLARHGGAKTLLDLVDLGVDDEELAGTVHFDTMRELLATTEAKVLLAVDEYNELYQPSHWHYGENKLEAPHLTATLPLVPRLIATTTSLTFADEKLAHIANPAAGKSKDKNPPVWLDTETGGACLPPPPANGLVVCATTGRYPPVKNLKKNKKWVPFESVAGRLAKAVSVPVEPYSRREFLRVLKRYARVEEVVAEPLVDMEVAKVHAKSDGLAEWVFETCQSGRYRNLIPE